MGMIAKKIGIIGCGNMGEALLRGLAKHVEKSTGLMVSETNAARRDAVQSKYKIIVEIDNNYLVKYADIIILAMKPQDLESVLKQEVCCGVSKDKLVISIAAGVTTAHIETVVGRDVPVVRAMPNMAATIGQSVTSISAGSAATREHMDLARQIFSAVGDVVEVDEKLVNAVTAISGSGPAYFFYVMEALEEAAAKLGIDPKIARTLVLKTALGSAMLAEGSGEEPRLIRQKVTSKGGTTEAALTVFETKQLKKTVMEAAEAAAARAKELSKG